MAFHSPLLADADAALARAFADVSPAEAAVGIDGKWSAAEICEHLAIAFELNRAALARAVAERRPRLRPATLWQRLGRWLVVVVGYYPRATAPESVRPTGEPGSADVETVRTRLAALDEALAAAAAVFGERTPVLNHPILGPFSVHDWRRFHATHVRHHMKQVHERVALVRERQTLRN